MSTLVYIEARRPTSPILTYRNWHRSPVEAMEPLAAAQNLASRGVARDWEYRLVPWSPPPVATKAESVIRQTYWNTSGWNDDWKAKVFVARPEPVVALTMHAQHSIRRQMEEVATEHLERIATEATAEAARRRMLRDEAKVSEEREKTALWMRVHGEAARKGFGNFLTGVVQAMASKTVLRWSKGHPPLGTKATGGQDWTQDEIFAAEQACYQRGHVPPWHLNGGQATSMLTERAKPSRQRFGLPHRGPEPLPGGWF